MAIVKLQKVTFYGLASQRDATVDGLQRLGCLHLIDLPGNGAGSPLDDAERHAVHDGIKYLQACPIQNTNQLSKYLPGKDCMTIAHEAMANQQRREELSDEKDHLERAIELMEPWGEFRLPDTTKDTRGLLFWFYQVPHHRMDEIRQSNWTWQLINQDRESNYILVIHPTEPNLSLPRISLDRRPLSELRHRLEVVSEELEKLHWERVTMTRNLTLLQRDLDAADDQIAREDAIQRMAQDEKVFALQAWTPQSTIAALQDFANRNHLAMTVSPPNRDELPPTLLSNPRAVSGAEGVVTFYITPAYKAWDPTWIMYASFTFFFAVIMSDAAYGLLLGVLLLFFWKKLGTSEKQRQLRMLLVAIVTVTILYGVAAGSYFGLTPKALERFQLKLDGQPLTANKEAMMILALGIGVLHLTLANLITAWRNLGHSQALSSVGWALGFLGGFVAGCFLDPAYPVPVWLERLGDQPMDTLQPQLKQLGITGMVVGLIMVFLFSSSRPFFSVRPSDWGWRLIDGVLGLTNVSKAFGDTLSYLRLFALGLASAQLAMTFNDLAMGVKDTPGLGFLLALLILLIGHGVNIVLGIMSGVVHGLRLNCIEFFNWSLTEEGYPFRAFSKKVG
jgi:V/A-type H+/Na+-transporting ATPase subunit I